MTNKTKAYIAIILQISIIGLSFLFVKEGLKYADTMTQLSHRFIVASVGILLIRMKMPHKPIFTKEVIKDLLPLGIFYPVLFFSLQTLALAQITTLEAGIISATIPIIILVLAMILLKEKPTWLQKIVMIIAFIGVLYINVNGKSSSGQFNLWGNVLMFFSAFSSGMYTITAKKVSKKYETIDMTSFMLFFGMIIFTLISIFQHVFGFVTISYFIPISEPTYISAILYLGVLSSLASSFLSNYAIHHVDASTIGLFSNLSPIITILAGIFILGEPIYSYQMIGMMIILIPIIFMNVWQNKKNKKQI